MKGSKFFILIAFLSGVVSCDTSSNVDTLYKTYFIKTFGGDGDQHGVDLLVNNDNTITLLGNTTKPSGAHRIYFVKTNLTGKILIEKELGDSTETAMDIEPIPNGYVILSNVFVSADRYDIKLLRTDMDGNVNDSVVFAGFGDQYGYSVTPLSDGTFFVAGNTRDIETEENAIMPITPGKEDIQDPLVIRFDNALVAQDAFRIGGSYEGLGVKIFEAGSDFTFAGYSDELMDVANSNYSTNFVFRTFKTDPRSVSTLYAGDNSAEEQMSAFVKMPSGSFYGIGTEISAAGLQVFIANILNVKDNTTPNVVPVKIFSQSIGAGRLEGVSGYSSAGGDAIFVLANEYDEAEETRNLRLLKVNVFGREVWSQQFGSAGNDDIGNAVAELPNGDVVIVGTVNLVNQHKLTLIKVNSKGRFN